MGLSEAAKIYCIQNDPPLTNNFSESNDYIMECRMKCIMTTLEQDPRMQRSSLLFKFFKT